MACVLTEGYLASDAWRPAWRMLFGILWTISGAAPTYTTIGTINGVWPSPIRLPANNFAGSPADGERLRVAIGELPLHVLKSNVVRLDHVRDADRNLHLSSEKALRSLSDGRMSAYALARLRHEPVVGFIRGHQIPSPVG